MSVHTSNLFKVKRTDVLLCILLEEVLLSFLENFISLLIHIKHSLNSLVPRNFHLKSLTPSKAFRNSQFITIFSFILFHISVSTYMFLHLLLRCSQRAASSFWSFTQNLKLFKISQYLQEKICVGDFFNKVEGLRSAILLKRDSNTGVSCEYW